MIKVSSPIDASKESSDFALPVTWNNAQDSVLEFLDTLERAARAASDQTLSITQDNREIRINPIDSWRVISNVHAPDSVSLCVRNIILDCVKGVEASSGFSGWVSLLTCIEGIKRHSRYRRFVDKDRPDGNARSKVNKVLRQIASLSHPTDLGSLRKIVHTCLRDNMCKNIVLDAYDLVGADGQIFIHKDVSSETILELINGYKFSCKIDPRFIASTKIEKWDRTTPKMFIIDGIIESVSEINRILEDASSKKYPGVLLALGFSEEVMATLSVNYLRGSLDILPLTPTVGIENINTLTDIAVVVGSDVVSSNKGDLMSSINPEETKHVDRVTSDLRGILIQNEPTKGWISAHVRHLLEKRDDEEVGDKVNLINLRLASLTSRYCHIRIGKNMEDELPLLTGRIETGIKVGREISKFGIINVNSAIQSLDQVNDLTVEIVRDTLRRLSYEGYDNISASSLILGIRSGLACCESIASTGYFVVVD